MLVSKMTLEILTGLGIALFASAFLFMRSIRKKIMSSFDRLRLGWREDIVALNESDFNKLGFCRGFVRFGNAVDIALMIHIDPECIVFDKAGYFNFKLMLDKHRLVDEYGYVKVYSGNSTIPVVFSKELSQKIKSQMPL